MKTSSGHKDYFLTLMISKLRAIQDGTIVPDDGVRALECNELGWTPRLCFDACTVIFRQDNDSTSYAISDSYSNEMMQ